MKIQSVGQVQLQVHTDAIDSETMYSLTRECERLAASLDGALEVRFEEGDDEGKYLNIVFDSHSPQELWPRINAALFLSQIYGPALQANSMALRTGEDGWNDYILLFHFDPSVPVEITQ